MIVKTNHLRKIIVTALFAALACVATLLIQIPSPMQGYINLGDCIVLLSGWLLGPVYGFCAGAIGSAMADLLTGYIHYVPATFVIKGLVALAACLFYRLFSGCFRGKQLPSAVVSGILAEIIMVLGYFAYAALLLGNGISAAAGIPGNLVQGTAGVVVGSILFLLLHRVKSIRDFLER